MEDLPASPAANVDAGAFAVRARSLVESLGEALSDEVAASTFTKWALARVPEAVGHQIFAHGTTIEDRNLNYRVDDIARAGGNLAHVPSRGVVSRMLE